MSQFPGNVVDALKPVMQGHFAQHAVLGRSVRLGDPPRTIGIFADSWEPIESSTEMGSPAPALVGGQPTLNRYKIIVQNGIISPDEEHGRAVFSNDAKMVRVILYRDPTLRASLLALSEELLDGREALKRVGVTRQRYLAGVIGSNWNFVATTELWVETEVTPIP